MNATVHGRLAHRFTILQITDFHHNVSDAIADRTYADVRQIIQHVQPDLLAVTGDIWCGDDDPPRGAVRMRMDVEALGDLGVPWTFTWGNHDYVADLRGCMDTIAAAPNAVMPEGDGRGNYRAELCMDGSPAWDLFMLNSRERGLELADVTWFEAETMAMASQRGASLPSIAFFHVPLRQYEFARLAGEYHGIAQEEVLFYDDDGDRFDVLRRPGTLKACFVGHSHVNDYWFEQEGVILAYGRATGHGGYGADRLAKGAKRITLHAGGHLEFETVFPDGSVWKV